MEHPCEKSEEKMTISNKPCPECARERPKTPPNAGFELGTNEAEDCLCAILGCLMDFDKTQFILVQ